MVCRELSVPKKQPDNLSENLIQTRPFTIPESSEPSPIHEVSIQPFPEPFPMPEYETKPPETGTSWNYWPDFFWNWDDDLKEEFNEEVPFTTLEDVIPYEEFKPFEILGTGQFGHEVKLGGPWFESRKSKTSSDNTRHRHSF